VCYFSAPPRGTTRTGTGVCRMILAARKPRNTLAIGPDSLDPTTSRSPSCQSTSLSADSQSLPCPITTSAPAVQAASTPRQPTSWTYCAEAVSAERQRVAECEVHVIAGCHANTGLTGSVPRAGEADSMAM
jgi:hypothetical protein